MWYDRSHNVRSKYIYKKKEINLLLIACVSGLPFIRNVQRLILESQGCIRTETVEGLYNEKKTYKT